MGTTEELQTRNRRNVTLIVSDEAKQMLVRHLAWLESPWRPLRHDHERGGAAHAARHSRRYGDGGDARHRKANQRLREELKAAGLLDRNGLTPAGKHAARSWTWPFVAAELVEALDRIDRHAKAGDCRAYGYVPETIICGCRIEQWPGPFAELQSLLRPAMADGVAEAASTMGGLAFYRLAAAWPDERDCLAVPNEPDIDDQLFDLYLAEYRAVWVGIQNDERHYNELGQLPLPASMELQSGRDDEDLSGIKPLFPEFGETKLCQEQKRSKRRNRRIPA